MHNPLILRVDKLNIVKWWVDTSYATHLDSWSHAGAKISLGWGSIDSMSNRQNINSGISTEVETIISYDKLPASLLSRYFIEAQGFKV